MGTITRSTDSLRRYIDRIDDVCASFPEGTPIRTPNGSIPIEQLRIGDKVISRSERTYESAPQLITNAFNRIASEYTVLGTEKGEITLTNEHPIWIQGEGWVAAESIEPGQVLATIDGDIVVYSNIVIQNEKRVYNLSINNTPSYFAGISQIWVHNTLCSPWLVNPFNTNLPRDSRHPRGGNGEWTGTRGNSQFQPTPDTPLHDATGGRPITYRNGYPEFDEFAYRVDEQPARVEIDNLRGDGSQFDFNRADEEFRNAIGDPDWEQPDGWSWHHHENCTTMILIPTVINTRAAHTGGAANIRNGTC